jgi:hypothetical protein
MYREMFRLLLFRCWPRPLPSDAEGADPLTRCESVIGAVEVCAFQGFFFSLEISEISAETGYSVTCQEKTVTEKEKNLVHSRDFMLKIRIYSLVMCVTVCIAFEVWMLVAFNAHRKWFFFFLK